MKVSTDSCILGAWFAERLPQVSTILDIGSGTGLLMIMIAQKSKAMVHGIELDGACYNQLQENVSHCVWKDRLSVFQGDARSFSFPVKYDFIISNPPFFENDLSSPVDEENLARHSSMLSLMELLKVINNNLSPYGGFGILLPYSRWQYFHTLCENQNFYLHEKVFVRHNVGYPFSRAILHYTRGAVETFPPVELNIRKKIGDEYTDDFIRLMKEYYLYL